MNEPILLVEDDASVRTTIVTFLELEGFGVEAVSNTRDALASGWGIVDTLWSFPISTSTSAPASTF